MAALIPGQRFFAIAASLSVELTTTTSALSFFLGSETDILFVGSPARVACNSGQRRYRRG